MLSERRLCSENHRDGGVVAVETAVVSLFLILMLFGITDSSFLFKDGLTVSAAARAGARMGASQPRSVTFGQDTADQVTNAISGLPATSLAGMDVWVYKANAATGLPSVSGLVPSGTNCTSPSTPKCLRYNWPVGATKLTYLAGTWASSSQNACNGDANRDTLGVYVKYPHSSPWGFFFKNAIMRESTVMLLEPIPVAWGCQ